MALTDPSFDIVLIGAGFAGASTAYHLSRKNRFRILLLEQESSFGVHASGRNAGMLRQAVTAPGVMPLIQETLRVLKDPPGDWANPKIFRQTGSLLVGGEPQVSAFLSALKEVGAKAEVYEFGKFPPSLPDRLREFLKQASYEALLFTPEDGVVDVHALLGNLLQASRSAGVVLRYNSPVTRLEASKDGWLVECGRQKFKTPVVINAAGAWAASLGRLAGLPDSEMKPFRRHLYISEPLPWVDPWWPFLWQIRDEFYFRPESGGLLLCPGDETPHPPGEPTMDPRMLEVLGEKFKNYFPALQALSIQRGWACLRTKRPDGRFQIKEDALRPGYFWVAALGGHGVSSCMGVGREAGRQIFDFLKSREIFGKLA